MRIRKSVIVVLIIGAIAFGVYRGYRDIARSAEREKAIRLVDEGKYAEALPTLVEILERNPNDVEVIERVIQATTFVGSHTVDDVMPLLNRWCELKKDDQRPYVKRMNAWLALDRTDLALEDGQFALQINPDLREVRCIVARLLRDAGRYDESERECKILLANRTIYDREVQFLLATVYKDQGDNINAAKIVAKILAEQPDYLPALTVQGEVFLNMHRYSEAVVVLNKAAQSRLMKVRRTALHALASALVALGKKEEAQQTFDRLNILEDAFLAKEDAQLRPGDLHAQLRAAQRLVEADYPEEAQTLLQSALNHFPNDETVLARLADCYEKLGQSELAKAYRIKTGSFPK